MIRALSRIKSEPWAITAEAMETIIEIASRDGEGPQAVAAKLGRPLENTHEVENRDGVAVMHITGPLFRYANVMTMLSGATSYDLMARDFSRAVNDDRVDAILLNIDSPGGEASGCSEFADMIHAARGRKPIVAYIGGSACSAAYWLASAADEIAIDATAQLGSIGVVLGIQDARERDAKAGIKRMEIVSSQTPYKRVDPATDDGRAKIQARIDALADVFVAKVARNRGVSTEEVLQGFGQGDVFVGQAAIDAGLADRIGSFEQVVSELQAKARGGHGFAIAAAGGNNQEIAMSEKTDGAGAGNKPEVLTAAQVAEQYPQAAAEISANAVAGERERIKGILASEEAAGREGLAQHLAFNTDSAVEAAVEMLVAAPKASAQVSGTGFEKLDAVMRAEGNADVGADADDNEISAEDKAYQAMLAGARAVGAAK